MTSWLPNAYPIEVYQLVVACLGLALEIWSVMSSLGDMFFAFREYRIERSWDCKKRFAGSILILGQELFLFSIVLVMVFPIGVFGVKYPPPPWSDFVNIDTIWRVSVYRWCYMYVTIACCLITLSLRLFRRLSRLKESDPYGVQVSTGH